MVKMALERGCDKIRASDWLLRCGGKTAELHLGFGEISLHDCTKYTNN